MKLFKITFYLLISLACQLTFANNTDITAKYFARIQNDPGKLYQFIYLLPKGGELHTHYSGAVDTNDLIHTAAKAQFCLDPKTHTLIPTCQKHLVKMQDSLHNAHLYQKIIDAWSMAGAPKDLDKKHQHFFATFPKLSPIAFAKPGELLATILDEAAAQHQIYMESILSPESLYPNAKAPQDSITLAKKIQWHKDYNKMMSELDKQGFAQAVQATSDKLNRLDQAKNQALACNSKQPQIGCQVTLRYIYEILRLNNLKTFFVNTALAFATADKNSLIVGINLVGAEDFKVAEHDYDAQLKIVDYFHQKYPHVHITLHAGELTKHFANNKNLSFHIRDAIKLGHAERIGHGVDIKHEEHYQALLAKMAKKKILVEVNLTSNDELLGIHGVAHPLPLYLKAHVPVALSTDDQGILMTNLSYEFLRATETYHLSYKTLKQLIRNSLTYSFLPGKSLWQGKLIASSCHNNKLGTKADTNCQVFLDNNAKAALQWQLERQLNGFEQQVANMATKYQS